MRQSFEEYMIAVLRLWLLWVPGGILSIAGLIANIVQWLAIPSWALVVIGLLGLFIAQFLAFHRVRVERDRLRGQPAPIIEVTPKMDYHDIYLDVHNIGEYAEFEAQVELLDGKNYALALPQIYSAYWDRTKRDKTKIMKGHKDRLKVANLEIAPRGLLMSFRLHYYETSYFEGVPLERIKSVNSTSWIPGSDQVSKPCFTLKVTISSNPSLKDGVFSRAYELSSEGFSEISS